MLCPRPRNSWREYSESVEGYTIVDLADGTSLRVMRASHRASVELDLAESYWEVLVSRSNGPGLIPELIRLEEIKDDPAVIATNKRRAQRESFEARRRGRQ